MAQLGRAIKAVPETYNSRGLASLVRSGFRYGRERLPSELWPALSRDPQSTADATVDLFDPDPVTVTYDGAFPDSLPPQLDSYTRRIPSPEGAVYEFDDVHIVGRHPVVEVNGRFFSASWFGVDTPFFVHQSRSLRRNLPLATVARDRLDLSADTARIDTGFLLLTERGNGFHHWFYEVLPKLRWFERYKEATGTDPKLIVKSPLRGYQRRSLELMGYSSEDLLLHGNERTAVDRLLLAPHPIRLKGNQLQAIPNELSWVGDRIRDAVPSDGERFADRVYVSRADANRRQVVNERDLLDLLSKRGFEVYEPGRFSLAEQVQLFTGADVIVGPHGMAYTNLIYSNDATLVELFPERGATETYYVATAELGLSYEFVECDAVGRGNNSRPRDKDLKVPVSRVERVLDTSHT